ncbi:SCO family protein [Marinomonas mediterranea]|uniref:Electron transport protein SCO1/SenC n=1 Tax=Marinomonas mediterranea (strain ATCC 700492 / JCM 21426 / NBRC 103028 / MMB-1) TaxID=717774 RepID=F2K131_MARM1|nr:SCO family protein [Marinomonas mediterranea]ADZ89881.1 electron transport protein SCO1/SenC [Marinomonas mediterranea MMB-1]WCN07966.1 SCO family protein [Marinomonas mediterranea]WCN12061.1 SCO family protein [Marinomonas mediterranea]WCN16099.1 SCO family protein [Marinomonas mediterranea MMB-1]
MLNKTKSLYMAFAVLLLAILATALYMQTNNTEKAKSTRLGGDFTLMTSEGPVSLSDFPNKMKLVFFGYTHCPDICPLTLANVKVALKQLPDDVRSQVQTIFISVDPKRDTPEHLSQYVHFFDPSFIGATDTQKNIDKVVKQYGAFYRFVDMPDSSMGYSVDHSAQLYLMGKDNKIKEYLFHDSSSEEIAETLKKAITG